MVTPVTPSDLSSALTALRERPPLVQCLTNIVVAQWTANVLLAVGAAPAMVDNPREAGPFAAITGGVLVNLGTPYQETASAMQLTVEAARAAGTPWVLDPVAAGGLGWRTELAHQLVAVAAPTILRGNASEVLAMVGGAGGSGVDSTDAPESAVDAASALARAHAMVVAVSGPVDHLSDGDRLVRVGNGHRWMTQVTGVGCALGALMAGFAAVVADPLVAATAATAVLTVAAEGAARRSAGPGSFAVALLDELSALTPDALAERANLS